MKMQRTKANCNTKLRQNELPTHWEPQSIHNHVKHVEVCKIIRLSEEEKVYFPVTDILTYWLITYVVSFILIISYDIIV